MIYQIISTTVHQHDYSSTKDAEHLQQDLDNLQTHKGTGVHITCTTYSRTHYNRMGPRTQTDLHMIEIVQKTSSPLREETILPTGILKKY